ncbi:MAG: flavodoxin family protein [Spirochaetaceae bacterium]
MKVIGICGSPKKEGSTTLIGLRHALKQVESHGILTSVIEMGKYSIAGCDSCGDCKKTGYCSIDDDFSNEIFNILSDPDVKGFIFASPVYFGGVTSQMKALIDRCVVFRRRGFEWENKVAGVLTIGNSRNGGQELAAMDLVTFSMIHGMVIVPDASPTSHFGGILHAGCEGGVENDSIGIETANNLGFKVGEITKKLHS